MPPPDEPYKPAEDEVGVLFQVADQEGVAQHAFRVNILREELQSKPVLKLVQAVLINRDRQQTQIDQGLPEILQGLRLPDAQFHRPDVGKRLTAGDTLLEPGETPTASVMLIAMCGGGDRADMVLVVGDARGYVASRALNIHGLGDRSLGDAAAAVCECPRDEWARGVSASLALVNDDVAITEVSNQLVEGERTWCGISIELDPTVPAVEALQGAPRPPLVLVRCAGDQLARRGLKTTTVDIAWAGGRIEAVAVREWPVPRTPRMWAEIALRTVSAPLVLHGMMSPGLRDAVVQQAIESIDMDAVAVAVDGAPAAQMVPSDDLEVAHPERLVIETAGNLFQKQPENGSYLAVSAMVAACMWRLEAGEELYAPKSTWRALEVRSRLYKARSDDDINAGQALATAHTCLEFLHALGLFEAAGRLDRADAARAIDCVMEVESLFRAANAPVFTCLLGVDGAVRDQAEIFASRLGVASFLTLRRVPELQKLEASIQGDYGEPIVARRALEAVEKVRRQLAMPNRESHTRGQPHVAAFCLSVLCQAAATRDRRVFVLGEPTERRVTLNLLLALPFDLLEAPLDESYLDREQRSRLRETISDLLLLWDLVRPDESKNLKRRCEACVVAESARSNAYVSDAYVSGQMLRDLVVKLRGDRASKRAGAQRKLLLRKYEPGAVYSNLIVRDPPVGLRDLLARFRVAPKLRDARPSAAELSKRGAAAEAAAAELLAELDAADSSSKKPKKRKKKPTKKNSAAAPPREAPQRAPVALPLVDSDESDAREAAARVPAPDTDEAKTASDASVGDVTADEDVAAAAPPLDVAADADDGDWTDVRSRRERRAATAPDEEARARASAREAEAREAEAASLALALRLEAEERASAPPPPAPMEEDGFRSFLGSLGMAHHADRLRAEAVESVEDLALLDLADIVACGVPAADAARIEAALAEFRVASEGAAVEESKSSGAAVPPPPPPLPKKKAPYVRSPPVAPAALDLGPFETMEALEALGLDRLKAALLAAGLKCGGTLRERAERLWSTRGRDRRDWDPKLFAKGAAPPPVPVPPRPPPPGTRPALSDSPSDVSLGAPARAKTLAQDELDAAAVHQERLESSLAEHRAELRRLRSVLSQREIPDALTCSITLEIMQDPVFATDGHTYERSAIESWLTNDRTSPKTGEPLATTVLFPNHGARQQISDLLEETRRLQAAIDASAEDEKHPS